MIPQTDTTDPELSFCESHPYQWIFALFWLVVAAILVWTLSSRPSLLTVFLAAAALLSAAYNWTATQCMRVEEGDLVLERRPFGRFGRRRWPLAGIVKFTAEPNRPFDDQIQTRPVKFIVYARLKGGRPLPLLTFFQKERAVKAVGHLNRQLQSQQRS